MAQTVGIPEKVAWVLVREGHVLVTRNQGRELFYFPGGMREPGESDAETLVREIDEELQAVIVAGSMAHFGTYEQRGEGHGGVTFRMICYTAEHLGDLVPAQEIDEMAWMSYRERERVSGVDQMVFDALYARGWLV